MHSQGVVNRDIKLENTLLDNSPRPLVKVCDFGYSKVTWPHSKKAVGAALGWPAQAPSSEPPAGRLQPRGDVAVLGQLLLSGAPHTASLACALDGPPQHEKFNSAPGSRVGTPAYLAPEVILTTRGKTYDGKVRCSRPSCPPATRGWLLAGKGGGGGGGGGGVPRPSEACFRQAEDAGGARGCVAEGWHRRGVRTACQC